MCVCGEIERERESEREREREGGRERERERERERAVFSLSKGGGWNSLVVSGSGPISPPCSPVRNRPPVSLSCLQILGILYCDFLHLRQPAVRDSIIITEIWNGRGRAEVAVDAICVASHPLSRPCHSLVTVAEECPLLSKLGSSGAGRVGAEYSLAVHCGVDHCRT